ncbi:MAG: hypothetical protein M5U18_10825 [Dehalococcoidia bacterium]|nr:hypothetical protein [Dehalococcoidia bacterium]
MRLGEGVAADDEVLDFLTVGQVFVDDAFEVFGERQPYQVPSG